MSQRREPGHPSTEVPPVTTALLRWLAAPDVLADPTQQVEGRVWTRAVDLLPGVRTHPGVILTACWGELTWTARPEWDPEDPAVLWLVPVTAPAPPPAPAQTYRAATLAADVVRQALPHDDGQVGAATREALERSLARALEPVVGDFDLSIRVVLDAVRRDRDAARAVLAWLARHEPRRRLNRFLSTPTGVELLRLARRARPLSRAVRGPYL